MKSRSVQTRGSRARPRPLRDAQSVCAATIAGTVLKISLALLETNKRTTGDETRVTILLVAGSATTTLKLGVSGVDQFWLGSGD